VVAAAREIVLRVEGVPFLEHGQLGPMADFDRWLQRCDGPLFRLGVEALHRALEYAAMSYKEVSVEAFDTRIREIFANERFAFDLIEGQVIPLASQELHAEVVEPALRLLSGRTGFESAEAAYQAALKELGAGEAADAITDAARALEQVLIALGCTGNALGPLLVSARSRMLLAGHDTPMGEVVLRAAKWVSADRGVMGDAHGAAARTRDDAWLTIHVVGALILRLAARDPRDVQEGA
jgi:hypothetical protein